MSEVQVRNSLPQLLVESGLMSEDEVRAALDRNPERTTTAADFAELLVESGQLTVWQANKLLQGKHRGFQLGPYRLLKHLAKGGMSSLYVARHCQSEELSALKVLPPAKAEQSDASYLPRFLREAKLACRLRHPNIIRVDEVLSDESDDSGVHFMAMELLEGYDLFNQVARRGPLPVRESVEIIRQAALGLEYAHGEGLVHRDVKPGNVFVTNDGRVKILDLGLAGLIEDAYQENLTREYNERVLGTADYLAPEQAVDSHRADARADIYALGCTFYFILSGRPPFTEGTLPQRILAHQTKQPRRVSSFRNDVPQELLQLLDHMLVKKRVDRVQSAQEVADRLQLWLDSVSGDTQFDQSPRMLTDGEPLAGRPLQKIQPSQKRNSETPTDSIRASETRTAPSVDRIAAQDAETGMIKDREPVYSPEFAGFLHALDRAWKVDTVMDPQYRQSEIEALSQIQSDTSIEGEDVSLVDPSPQVAPEWPRFRTRMKGWPVMLTAITVIVILLLVASALPSLRSLFASLFLT